MRILVTGGAGFIGSHYVRQLLAGALPGLRRRRGDGAGQAHLRGQRGQPRAGRGNPTADGSSRATSATASWSPTLMRRHGRGRALRRRVARRPVDLRRGRLRADQRAGHPDPAAGARWTPAWPSSCTCPPTRCTARSTRAPGPRTHRWSRTRRTRRPRPASDLLARAYARTHGLPVVITRCSNNYGPYQFPEKVIPLFVTNLIDGEKVPLYGDGRNVRDWLHVDDHCRGIQLVLEGGRGRGDLQHRRRHRADQPGADRAAARRDRRGTGTRSSSRSPTARATTGATRSTSPRSPPSSGYAPAGRLRPRVWPTTVAWYRDNRAWWEPLKQRATAAPADGARTAGPRRPRPARHGPGRRPPPPTASSARPRPPSWTSPTLPP